MKTIGDPFYRLYDRHCHEGIVVFLEKWLPVKKTPAGTWLRSEYSPSWEQADFKFLRKQKYLKFVLDNSTRKYCYPTMDGAVNSFKHRKRRQQAMLRYQLEQADVCVNNLDKLDNISLESFYDPRVYEGFGGVLLGEPDSHNKWDFE